jgi:hypothetical protein
MISSLLAQTLAELLVRLTGEARARQELEERLAIRAARASADEKARSKFRAP